MSHSTSVATSRQTEGHSHRGIYLRLVVVALLWGATWPLMKSVLPDIAPVTFVVVRFVLSAMLMALASLPLRQPVLPVKGERAWLGFIGFWQVAANVGVAGIALQYLGAGRASVLVYTMQLWALPLGWLILGERITAKALVGGLIGFSGLILLVNPGVLNWHDSKTVLGYVLALVAAVSWSLGACDCGLPAANPIPRSLDRRGDRRAFVQCRGGDGACLFLVGKGADGVAGGARRTNGGPGSHRRYSFKRRIHPRTYPRDGRSQRCADCRRNSGGGREPVTQVRPDVMHITDGHESPVLSLN
jgi:hypothetical protein